MIRKTETYVRDELWGESSGHDWWHIYRVRQLALHIAKREEGADLFVVNMASLLHDIGDPKLHEGDTSVAPRLIGGWLDTIDLHHPYREHIMHIIANMSFSKSLEGRDVKKSLEFMIVQDADRLDAVGAVGIARTFAYGGNKNREMYNPHRQPEKHLSAAAYHASDGTTVNHFYEKLLLLKDTMNTETGKKIAEGRHVYMEDFLKRFYEEWEGEA